MSQTTNDTALVFPAEIDRPVSYDVLAIVDQHRPVRSVRRASRNRLFEREVTRLPVAR
jgi:hypothetical protein